MGQSVVDLTIDTLPWAYQAPCDLIIGLGVLSLHFVAPWG